MKLGVISDCFKRPRAESIALAGALGLEGIQMYAVGGDICPDALLGNEAKLNEYKDLLKKHGLTVSALCGDRGGHGFEREAENAARIEKTCRIVDLALAFDTKVVTTHIGVIPEDETSEKYQTMLKALKTCGAYAAARGVTLAIETGPETAPILNKFVTAAGEGVGVSVQKDHRGAVVVAEEYRTVVLVIAAGCMLSAGIGRSAIVAEVSAVFHQHRSFGGILETGCSDTALIFRRNQIIQTVVGRNILFAGFRRAEKQSVGF